MVTDIMSKKQDSKNGVFPRNFRLSAKLWQKSADHTDVLSPELSPDINLKKFPLAIVERAFYHNNTSYVRGKGGTEGNAGRYSAG